MLRLFGLSASWCGHKVRARSRYLLAALFVTAGLSHFLFPEPFVRIVPPALPAPLGLVYLSGLLEVLGGLGLLSRYRRPAAWGLVLLLVAVYPANLYMAMEPERAGAGIPPLLLWLRLPLQFVLGGWLLWAVRPPRDSAD
ncbi:MAG: DoxX family membrane protein [Deinococcota bacterium]|jgi:uncharacterized membrane protein|nr:DoxX family membrane protein [Deinococcota bacterium]